MIVYTCTYVWRPAPSLGIVEVKPLISAVSGQHYYGCQRQMLLSIEAEKAIHCALSNRYKDEHRRVCQHEYMQVRNEQHSIRPQQSNLRL